MSDTFARYRELNSIGRRLDVELNEELAKESPNPGIVQEIMDHLRIVNMEIGEIRNQTPDPAQLFGRILFDAIGVAPPPPEDDDEEYDGEDYDEEDDPLPRDQVNIPIPRDVFMFLIGNMMPRNPALLESVPVPLKESLLKKIPIKTYGETMIKYSTCSICLMDFEPDSQFRDLPCSHIFHPECIDRWLQQKPTCPVCKVDLRDKLCSKKKDTTDIQ